MTLAWVATAFIAGVVLAAISVIPIWLAVALVLAVTALAWRLRRQGVLVPAVIALAFAAGMVRGVTAAGNHLPAMVKEEAGRTVTLDGVVSAEPDVRDTGANYRVAVSAMVAGGRTISVHFGLQVHTPRSVALDYGDRVQLTGKLVIPRDTARAPVAEILARQGLQAEMSFPRVRSLGRTSLGPLDWTVALREGVERRIDAWLPEPEAALLIAIVLGAHAATLGGLAPILVKTGLIHVIAISGIKVALVAGMVAALARPAGNRLLVLLLSWGGVAGYVVLTGFTASGVRSGIMWALVFLATYLGRNTVALVSLAVAAAVMVGLDPSLWSDSGFQMSTVGTMSIVGFSEKILAAIWFTPSPFREALGVTTAAQLGTLPIVASDFHIYSISGLVANAVALPLLPMAIVLGFLLAAAAPFSALAAPIAAVAYVLVHVVVWLATELARLPGVFSIRAFSAPALFAYYGGLVFADFGWMRRGEFSPLGQSHSWAREFGFGCCVAAALLTISPFVSASRTDADVTWMGSGGSILIRSGAQSVLVDGSAHPTDLLNRLGQALSPFDRRLDALIITDPRATNVEALSELLRHYQVGEVMDVGAQYPSSTYAALRRTLSTSRVPVFALRTGAVMRLSDANARAIAPDGVCAAPPNCTAIVRLRVGSTSLLLLGNASRKEQVELLFRPVDLRASILVSTAKTGVDPRLARAVHPGHIYAVASGSGDAMIPLRQGTSMTLCCS